MYKASLVIEISNEDGVWEGPVWVGIWWAMTNRRRVGAKRGFKLTGGRLTGE